MKNQGFSRIPRVCASGTGPNLLEGATPDSAGLLERSVGGWVALRGRPGPIWGDFGGLGRLAGPVENHEKMVVFVPLNTFFLRLGVRTHKN